MLNPNMKLSLKCSNAPIAIPNTKATKVARNPVVVERKLATPLIARSEILLRIAVTEIL